MFLGYKLCVHTCSKGINLMSNSNRPLIVLRCVDGSMSYFCTKENKTSLHKIGEENAFKFAYVERKGLRQKLALKGRPIIKVSTPSKETSISNKAIISTTNAV